MAVLTLLGSTTFSTSSGTKTVTATPAVDDLIVIVCAHTGNTSAAAPTDNNSDGLGTYTLVGTQQSKNSSADTLGIWVRDALIGSASSTVFTHAPGSTTGGGLAVHKITGMSRAGSSAVKQSAGQSNQAASGTPTLSFGANLTAGNVFLGAVFNASNPAGMTPPTGCTERTDVGYNSPASGLETTSRDSVVAVSSVPWGNTSSAFCSAGVELDVTTPLFVGRADETDTAYALGLQHMRAIETDTASAPTQVLIRGRVARVDFLIGAETTDGSGNLAIDVSSLDIQQNDVVVTAIASQDPGGTNRSLSCSGNNTSAYTERGDLWATDTVDCNLGTYTQRQGATPDTTITFSHGGVTHPVCYAIVVYRGVISTGNVQLDVASFGGSSSTVANPSTVDTVDGGKGICFWTVALNVAQTWTLGAGPTDVQSTYDSNPTPPTCFLAFGDFNTTGATWAPPTLNGSPNDTDSCWYTSIISLRPDIPIETDTAFALGRLETYNLGRSDETDTAFALVSSFSQQPGLATETDTSLALVIGHAPSLAIETDTSYTPGLGLQANYALENDAAFALFNLAIGRADEADSAFSLTQGLQAAAATESNTAFALSMALVQAVGMAAETDTAFTRSFDLGVGTSIEVNTAYALDRLFIRDVTAATETDIASNLSPLVILPVGLTISSGIAFACGFARVVERANETDSAFALAALSSLPLGRANEFDQAFQMFGALNAGSARKPYIDLRGLLRDRIQRVHSNSVLD